MTRAGRRDGAGAAGLAIVALITALIALAGPGVVAAGDGRVKLSLRPIDQAGAFFDLTMRPGDTRRLEVEILNAGDGAIAARTYAADVYTIVNGGFGGLLRGEHQTGMTGWLDYATDVLRLPPGKIVQRGFTVTVPRDAGPGEYISSLVLENDQPIQSNGVVALAQIVRQAVAVVVTVPGQRSPALAIGAANHRVVAGTSVVAVAVRNTGNVRLKPLVRFTLFDAAGVTVSEARVPMDTFYAHTDTFIEVPLDRLLLTGAYTVRLTLDDPVQGVQAEEAAIPLVVEAPSTLAAGGGAVPGLTGVVQGAGEGQILLPIWSVVLVASLALGGLVVGLLVWVRRRRTGFTQR